MNKLVSRILPTTALTGILLLSVGSWAQMPEHHERDGANGAHRMERMTEMLSLTEEQQTQITAIFEKGKDSAKDDRKRMHEIRKALAEQSKDFDADETQKLADELGELTSRMSYQMTSQKAQVNAVLTPEQREKLEEKMERGKDRKGRKGKRSDKS